MVPPRPASILFLIADCPGHFTATMARLAAIARASGFDAIFAVTSPFYPRFKGVPLAGLGSVHDLSAYLRQPQAGGTDDDAPLDFWLTYPTYVRTSHFWGRHLNAWDAYRRTTRFFSDIFDRHPGITLVVSENPSNAFLCLGYAETRRRHLPYLGYLSGRIPGHFNVGLDLETATMLENPAPPSYRHRPGDVPDYMKTGLNVLLRDSFLGLFRGGPERLLAAWRGGTETSIEIGSGPTYLLRAWWMTATRKFRAARLLRTRHLFVPPPAPGPGPLRVLFPLQFRPESSTSVQAPFYENDLETIKNLAFSLPHRAELWIKEHSPSVGMRPLDFYRRCRSFPNVRLLHPEISLRDHLGCFDALVTLTSTAGFEAIQHGVPVLLLGRVFYEDYPHVIRIRSWDDLRDRIRALTPGAPRMSTDEPMRRYLRVCFPGSFDYMNVDILNPDNLDRLAAPMLMTAGRQSRENGP